jgi:hypothetical protein
LDWIPWTIEMKTKQKVGDSKGDIGANR